MSSPTSIPVSRAAPTSNGSRLLITLTIYALILLAVTLSIPLQIPEVLQAIALQHGFLGWIAEAPGSAPLNPVVQLPFLLLGGPSRLGARFVSVAFAVGASYLFLRLTKRIPLERPYWALLLFMLLPLHFSLAFEARPFEQALFLVVLSTGLFFRLVFRPSVKNALLYSGCLTLCVYTDRYSLLPAFGYVLFLLRFVNRKQERRAMWYVLAATVPPVLLFLPYAAWAHTQVNPNWLAELPSLASPAVYVRALRAFAAPHWATYLLWLLLCLGLFAGSWSTFRLTGGPIGKRIRLFVLVGGFVCPLLFGIALDLAGAVRFTPSELLWTTPAVVILVFAGLEWLAKQPVFRPLTTVFASTLLAVSVAADAEFLFVTPDSQAREDLRAVAAAVPAQLTGDSCVVFVSERLSQTLFRVFEPDLVRHECLNFFHSKVVLASHPYVTPDQQQDAESYFRGLNFIETKRIKTGGGQIVVMQQHGP